MGKNLFIEKHFYTICLIVIMLLAFVLRFYGYNHRWGLAYDQAHDAIVAREALRQHKIPLLGPFSSAGPFVTGPQWYWFIMLATFIYPSAVITPWVILTGLFVASVYLMFVIGSEIENKMLGLIIALLTAVSTAEIAQSTNLANQAPLTLLSAFALWCAVRYLKRANIYYLFFLALSISLGINTHLQGVLLLSLLLVIFFKPTTIKGYFFIFIGLFLPCIPLLIFELRTHFYDTRGMLQYYLHDQYKVSLEQLGRRWITFLGKLLPQFLAEIIGGYKFSGYAIPVVVLISLVLGHAKRKIPQVIFLLLTTTILAIITMRYTRTPLFGSYLMFLHPWIFVLVGWSAYILLQKQKILGAVFLLLLIIGSLQHDIKEIRSASNYTAIQAKIWEKALVQRFPNKKFAMYDYRYKTANKSVPLSLFLTIDNLINDKGEKIGVVIATRSSRFVYPGIFKEKEGYQLYILSASTTAQLTHDNWIFVNPSEIYRKTEEWYENKKL